jgi:hypothetical protein
LSLTTQLATNSDAQGSDIHHTFEKAFDTEVIGFVCFRLWRMWHTPKGANMRSSKFITTAASVIAAAAFFAPWLTTPASAVPIFDAPTPPNQNWTGSLGLDFTVNQSIVISGLGAYSGVGATADITVEVFKSDGTPIPGLAAVITTTSSPYTWQSVVPVTLAPGTYQIAAWGYGTILNYNTGIAPGTAISFDTLGGALSLGLPYYNNPNQTGFATILDDFNGCQYGCDHYYGAGNIDAALALGPGNPGDAPLPSAWLLMLSGFFGFGYFARRGVKRNSAFSAA